MRFFHQIALLVSASPCIGKLGLSRPFLQRSRMNSVANLNHVVAVCPATLLVRRRAFCGGSVYAFGWSLGERVVGPLRRTTAGGEYAGEQYIGGSVDELLVG